MENYNPAIVRLLSQTYGEFCAQILMRNASPEIREVLHTIKPSTLSAILRQHTSRMPDIVFKIWQDEVLHADSKRPISLASSSVILGQTPPSSFYNKGMNYLPNSSPYSSGQSLFPNHDWSFELVQVLAPKQDSSSPPSPKSLQQTYNVSTSLPASTQGWNPGIKQRIPPTAAFPKALPSNSSHIFVPNPAVLRPSALVGRGVIIKGLPIGITLAKICRNVAGGKIERIDFQDGEARAVVGIYFVKPEAAHAYKYYVNAKGGINWGKGAQKSSVDLIPIHMGGFEKIKQNVQLALDTEHATRCLEITGLLNSYQIRPRLMNDIIHQSKVIRPAFESCNLIKMDGSSRRRAIIRMGSIGTALGARLVLSRNGYYNDTSFRFLPDPCDRALETLGAQWAEQEAKDLMGTLHGKGEV